MVRASRCLPGEMAYLAKTADLQTVRQVASKVGGWVQCTLPTVGG